MTSKESHLPESDIAEIGERLGEDAREFAGRRVLITGAGGFLGRYFVRSLLHLNATILRDPCEIIAIDNFVTGGLPDMPQDRNLAFVRHDIIKPFYPERPVDFVMHAAGIASPQYYRKFPLETLEVATTGLKNVLQLAREQPSCRLVFFSSSEIYGDPDPGKVPIEEHYRGNVSPLGPRACYDESKRLGETLTRIYAELHKVKGCIVRPFNVYGPGMRKRDFRVLPNFADKILSGEPIVIYGDGHQTRTFCYATDAIVGFFKALLHGTPGEPYNIGNPEPEISVQDLADHIVEATGHTFEKQVRPHPNEYPADEPQRRCPSIEKAIRDLDYIPRVDLKTGLKRFFDWAEEAYR